MKKEEINKRLLEILKELKEILPNYSQATIDFELRKAELYMQEESKGFANQSLRDAYVLKVLDTEKKLRPFEELKNKIKLLYIEKEIIIEMGRNIRGEREKAEEI